MSLSITRGLAARTFLLFALLTATFFGYAQNITGEIDGTVKDAGPALAPGATVEFDQPRDQASGQDAFAIRARGAYEKM